jgi:hypothetical protein
MGHSLPSLELENESMSKAFVHVTREELVESILATGLRTDMPPDLTTECAWALAHYGANPVFLCIENSDFHDAMTRFGDYGSRPHLEVDTSELALVADIASLVDHKGVYNGVRGHISWRKGREPEIMTPFLDGRSSIAISRLLDPNDEACKAAIALTGTAACTTDIPPSKLAIRQTASTPLTRR